MPQLLIVYLLLINLLGFILYGIDKTKSKRKGSRRIPERTLLWVARLGGGLGCWLGMDTVPKSVSERWRVKKGTGHCRPIPKVCNFRVPKL